MRVSSPTTTRKARLAVPLLAGALALVPLAGCSFTSNNVSCSGTECTATLTGEGSEASILGNSLVFAGTQDGRAALSVGGAEVSCAAGESVNAGPLRVTCTGVTDDAVELSASLG